MFFRQKSRVWGIFAVCICFIVAYYYFTQGKHACFEEPSIFFIETSGSPRLNPRQACAVESTARHNPSMKTCVLMTPPDSIEFSHILIKKLNLLQNIHFSKTDISVLVQNSPISKWYEQGKWKKSKWKASHISDGLRFLLLLKYGGIYLDLDVVSLRSLEHLRNAAIATPNWTNVAPSILIFDKNHELIRNCIDDFAQKYDPYKFAYNGPVLFTDNVQKFCNQNMDEDLGTGCDVHVLPPDAAFPISYKNWKDYFIHSSVENINENFNSSYLIHVWNLLSKNYVSHVGSNSLYELAMKQHCPIVYDHILEIGTF